MEHLGVLQYEFTLKASLKMYNLNKGVFVSAKNVELIVVSQPKRFDLCNTQ